MKPNVPRVPIYLNLCSSKDEMTSLACQRFPFHRSKVLCHRPGSSPTNADAWQSTTRTAAIPRAACRDWISCSLGDRFCGCEDSRPRLWRCLHVGEMKFACRYQFTIATFTIFRCHRIVISIRRGVRLRELFGYGRECEGNHSHQSDADAVGGSEARSSTENQYRSYLDEFSNRRGFPTTIQLRQAGAIRSRRNTSPSPSIDQVQWATVRAGPGAGLRSSEVRRNALWSFGHTRRSADG
jgi:hypothetical protein